MKDLITELELAGLKEGKCYHRLMYDENGCPFGFHVPLLSDLINECDGFVCLRKNADLTFAAFGGNEKYPDCSCERHGSTAEEAVAKLWLALNQK